MRNQIAGGGAVLIGIAIVLVVLLGDGPVPVKPLLGGLAFIGVGAYYLLVGKKAASLKEFVVDGKMVTDEADGKKL
ncbi:hypothetical protein [Polaromonas sp. P5_D5]